MQHTPPDYQKVTIKEVATATRAIKVKKHTQRLNNNIVSKM